MKNTTIDFYNKNSIEFFKTTVNSDMDPLYKPFLNELKSGDKILDAGCGSGRDSLYFKGLGYDVTAFDGSIEMVNLSSKLLNQEVFHTTFEDFKSDVMFDGIWACASLLHINNNNIIDIINKLTKQLKNGGIFYMSFKYGEKEYEKDGRYFNCYTEDSFKTMISEIYDLKIQSLYVSGDVRPGRENEKWLNVICKKEFI